MLYPAPFRPVLAPFTAHAAPFSTDNSTLTTGHDSGPPENDEDAAARIRGEVLSYGQIATRLRRSKSWAHAAVNGRPVEYANGSAV